MPSLVKGITENVMTFDIEYLTFNTKKIEINVFGLVLVWPPFKEYYGPDHAHLNMKK